MPPTKKDIISRVTAAALHILHDSQLFGSNLWPKNGVVVPATANHDAKDVIEVRPLIHTLPDGTTSQILRLNMFNDSYARVKKQQMVIEPILDHSIYDNIHFTFDYSRDCGMGLDRTMGMMNFNFTIND